jgi:hypothetical protein
VAIDKKLDVSGVQATARATAPHWDAGLARLAQEKAFWKISQLAFSY